ncbi:MAG TPA: family 10 glycosylhydrolase [Blastocatellia bacterium]|nr:family 10 glycosylhydrolase [Blastocatellia bacterium]
MRRALLIMLAYSLFFLSAVLALQKAAAPESSFVPPVTDAVPREVRALWVVRTSLTSPESIIEMVRRAREAEFTDLVVQVRGRGDAYYNSRWEPRAAELAGTSKDFDPLALVISQAHAAGIKVHAWINTFLVANARELPGSREHVIYKHPDWLAVPKAIGFELYKGNPRSSTYFNRLISFAAGGGEELEGLYLSPAHPAAREEIYGIWMDVLERYDVDGMHFDYIRYPNPQFDYSRTSLERFRGELEKTLDIRERARLARLAEDDPLVYAAAYPDRYAQFQRDQVTDLVERVYTGVKARKPRVIVSAAVWANDEDAYSARFQDWKLWLRQGILDVVCPMAYSKNTETFTSQIENAVTSAAERDGAQVWAGISAWRQPVEGSLEKISAAREAGAGGFILFSYDSTVKVSENNPEGDYLLRVRDALKSKPVMAAD